MRRAAVVWFERQVVGVLRETDQRKLTLYYDEQWLDSGFPVSIAVPLRAGGADATSFFYGLLPEGRTRARICKTLRISEDDDTGLLFAIGEDCAGALSILPEDRSPSEEAGAAPALSEKDFEQLVENKGVIAYTVTQQPQRFSIAGVQDKLPLIRRGARYFLPNAAHPSTHIIKFETIKKVCFAEHMAMVLARRAGLTVSDNDYCVSPSETPYLSIRRFDRIASATSVKRLHQEDFTQALGYRADEKYEEHGGPSLATIVETVRRHTSDPVRGVAQIRDWQILNFLIGNFDGHAKNIALLYSPGASVPSLAPFYDLVCIELLHKLRVANLARSMAFRIGEHDIPERVTRDDWLMWAKALSLPGKRVLARLAELAEQLPALAKECRASFAATHGDNQVYDQFEEVIADRSRWTLQSIITSR